VEPLQMSAGDVVAGGRVQAFINIRSAGFSAENPRLYAESLRRAVRLTIAPSEGTEVRGPFVEETAGPSALRLMWPVQCTLVGEYQLSLNEAATQMALRVRSGGPCAHRSVVDTGAAVPRLRAGGRVTFVVNGIDLFGNECSGDIVPSLVCETSSPEMSSQLETNAAKRGSAFVHLRCTKAGEYRVSLLINGQLVGSSTEPIRVIVEPSDAASTAVSVVSRGGPSLRVLQRGTVRVEAKDRFENVCGLPAGTVVAVKDGESGAALARIAVNVEKREAVWPHIPYELLSELCILFLGFLESAGSCLNSHDGIFFFGADAPVMCRAGRGRGIGVCAATGHDNGRGRRGGGRCSAAFGDDDRSGGVVGRR